VYVCMYGGCPRMQPAAAALCSSLRSYIVPGAGCWVLFPAERKLVPDVLCQRGRLRWALPVPFVLRQRQPLLVAVLSQRSSQLDAATAWALQPLRPAPTPATGATALHQPRTCRSADTVACRCTWHA
jgi:hypothetical protein